MARKVKTYMALALFVYIDVVQRVLADVPFASKLGTSTVRFSMIHRDFESAIGKRRAFSSPVKGKEFFAYLASWACTDNVVTLESTVLRLTAGYAPPPCF